MASDRTSQLWSSGSIGTAVRHCARGGLDENCPKEPLGECIVVYMNMKTT